MSKYKELYEERAAIIEFDGGLTRKKSEEKALNEISDLYAKDHNLAMNEAKSYRIIANLKKDLKND